MNLTILPILLLTFSLSAIADRAAFEERGHSCVKTLGNPYDLPQGETVDISNCKTKDLSFELSMHIMRESGYQFEGSSLRSSNLFDLLKLLKEDFHLGDGDHPFSNEEIQKVVNYVLTGDVSGEFQFLHHMDSYYSGTGITGYAVLKNSVGDQLTLIRKFMYAE